MDEGRKGMDEMMEMGMNQRGEIYILKVGQTYTATTTTKKIIIKNTDLMYFCSLCQAPEENWSWSR